MKLAQKMRKSFFPPRPTLRSRIKKGTRPKACALFGDRIREVPDGALLEEALHAVEETLRLGIVLVAAFLEGGVELAEQVLLLGGEVDGRLHGDVQEEIAELARAQVLHALAPSSMDPPSGRLDFGVNSLGTVVKL